MILRSITLENFGLYAGRQTLDLIPGSAGGGHRPVILIGGKNGAGKTTLLEAVRLALYGRRALGSRVGQSEYEDHLRGRMHIDASGAAPETSSVGLEFDYAEAGVIQHYGVSRTWSVVGAKPVEVLTLTRDGQPVTSVPREEWHQFLQELIPPGVSQLFFFDGEKIADIAHDGSDEGLAEAVRGLLGIDLVGRLRVDLALYLARHSRSGDRGAAERLEAAGREVRDVEQQLEAIAGEIGDLTRRSQAAANNAHDVKLRYFAEGGDVATRREALEAARDEAMAQNARRMSELRELANGLLPFAAAPKLVARLARTLAATGGSSATHEAEALRERLLAWRATGDPERKASWKESHWADIESFLALDRSGAGEPAEGPIRGLSAIDRQALLEVLGQVRETTIPAATFLAAELEAQGDKLAELESSLVRARGHGASALAEELALADRQSAELEATLRVKTEEHKQLEHRHHTAKREQDRLMRAQNEADAAVGRANLAQRVGSVLEQYEARLMEQKLVQLEHAFVSRFNHLARKGDFVANVRIDRATFEATLIDKTGREISKASLSAGEKQIYAVAMLWALARTSGRPLPMIIDTPLARLDLDHRSALVERYFPEASHQVIVLSTDTEIDEALLGKIGGSVSHAYRLDYDHELRATRVVPGYFGDRSEEDVRAIQQG